MYSLIIDFNASILTAIELAVYFFGTNWLLNKIFSMPSGFGPHYNEIIVLL